MGFNWVAVLKDAVAGAQITEEDQDKLRIMAGNWPTCACGQLCKNLPKQNWDNKPLDNTLASRGLTFFHCIEEQDWTKALATFYKIEARTMELLDNEKVH